MLQTNRIEKPDRNSYADNLVTPAMDKIGRSPVEVAPGLTAERHGSTLILCWEHRAAAASPSQVQFEVHLGSGSSEVYRQTLAGILQLYERDYLRQRASNPVITAFFRGLAAKPGVALRSLENCSVVNGTISFKTAASETTLRNLELHSCRLELEAKKLDASQVSLRGASVLTIEAGKTRWQGVRIDETCVMNGSLGHGVIEADCCIHSSHAEKMNFRGIKWLESPSAEPFDARMNGLVFTNGLVSEEFLRQGKYRTLSDEEAARLKAAAGKRLDEAWG